ncbi:uncharacterized protein LOC126735244 [Anthonomus grandis grandis]|uniref:uncharacterized protein LOC126735244 n=1 Tax=Anthonomus grandis grandis TaxID=2921223 RepID=UPI002166AE9A|nr:uncharacterized protein LOC126735244 [Anthonomus grandis grandis]
MFTLCMSRGPPPLQQDHANERKSFNKKKIIKGGFLLRYQRGFFCKGWCEEWVVLFEDSTLAWYADKTLSRPRGYVRVGEAPELLAVGEWTRKVPRKPRFPRSCHINQLLAVGCHRTHDVHWLMATTPAEMNDWMTAISNTLPPPPNIPITDKRLTLTPEKVIANGHAHPVANGCATIIPNGKIPSAPQPPTTTKTKSTCSKPQCYAPNTQALSTKKDVKKDGLYHNDHTVLAGVCVDWGQGWGWSGQVNAIAPQISFTTEMIGTSAAAIAPAVYCHTDTDYSMTGYDDFDWSAFGDFCF